VAPSTVLTFTRTYLAGITAASVDNDQKGILIFRRSVYEMPRDSWYTG